MTFAATLNGNRVTAASVIVPASGRFHLDVVLADPAVVAGPCEFALGDLVLACAVVRGGAWQGAARYRLAGGAGRWADVVAPRGYQQPGAEGVRLRDVLADAAADVGEVLSVDASADRSLGNWFARERGPASRLLQQLAGSGWWVDPDGTTRVGARAGGAVSGAFDVIKVDALAGRATVASEDVARFVPGLTIDVGLAAPIVASTVRHVLEVDKVRTEVWAANGPGTEEDRTTRAMRAFVREALPALTYASLHRYRVHAQVGDLLDLETDDPLLPDLSGVSVRPGVAGVRATIPAGASVLVGFENGDPGRPFAAHHEVAAAGGFAPTDASWTVDGDLALRAGPTGASPAEHAASAEAVVLTACNLLTALGVQLALIGPPGPLTSASLAAWLAVPTNVAAVVGAMLTAGVVPAPTSTLAYYPGVASVLAGALAGKVDDPTGMTPGPGWPGVRGG